MPDHRTYRRYALIISISCAVLAGGLCTDEARAQEEQAEIVPGSPGVQRYSGPVRLSLTALVIAPGKTSGLPWDGPGQLPNEVATGIRKGLGQGVVRRLFRALSLGTPPLALLAELESWTVGAFIAGTAAPDIQASIYVDGQLIAVTQKVANDYVPTWAGRFTRPVTLGRTTQIDIKVIDRDLAFDDDVGTCTIQGMPYVDDHGYVIAQSFRCWGQVWAVALRAVPVEPQPGDRNADEQ